MAALKVRFAAEYVQAAQALASPAASPHEAAAWEMSSVAERSRTGTYSLPQK